MTARNELDHVNRLGGVRGHTHTHTQNDTHTYTHTQKLRELEYMILKK